MEMLQAISQRVDGSIEGGIRKELLGRFKRFLPTQKALDVFDV